MRKQVLSAALIANVYRFNSSAFGGALDYGYKNANVFKFQHSLSKVERFNNIGITLILIIRNS
jgi:hypothetical protein